MLEQCVRVRVTAERDLQSLLLDGGLACMPTDVADLVGSMAGDSESFPISFPDFDVHPGAALRGLVETLFETARVEQRRNRYVGSRTSLRHLCISAVKMRGE